MELSIYNGTNDEVRLIYTQIDDNPVSLIIQKHETKAIPMIMDGLIRIELDNSKYMAPIGTSKPLVWNGKTLFCNGIEIPKLESKTCLYSYYVFIIVAFIFLVIYLLIRYLKCERDI